MITVVKNGQPVENLSAWISPRVKRRILLMENHEYVIRHVPGEFDLFNVSVGRVFNRFDTRIIQIESEDFGWSSTR